MYKRSFKHWIFLGLILALLVTLTACDVGRVVEEHDVTVMVIEADNDERVIKDVDVKLENFRTYEDNTGDEGVATFSNVREGSYELTATKDGWVAVEGVGEVLINRDRIFIIQMAEVDEPVPGTAFFEVEIVDYRTEVTTLGEDVEIQVRVTNTGSASGKVYIDLFENEFVEDEWVVDEDVELDPGESETVELSYEPEEELGIAEFIVQSYNETTDSYDDSDTAWGVVLEENSFAVGFDRAEGDTDNFGDEESQYLDFVTNIELGNDDWVEDYTITIEYFNQQYTLEHVGGILQFDFVRNSNWFDIEVATDDGDISEAVEGLSFGYIENITNFKVVEVLIWDEDGFGISVPGDGVEIVEWEPAVGFLDGNEMPESSERIKLRR